MSVAINVRRVSGVMKEVKIESGSISIDLGFLEQDECEELASDLRDAADDLSPAPDYLAALTQLTFMARTSGDPTPELLKACEGAEAVIAKRGVSHG